MMGLKDINAKNAYVTAVAKAEALAVDTGTVHYVVKVDGAVQVTTTRPADESVIKYTARSGRITEPQVA